MRHSTLVFRLGGLAMVLAALLLACAAPNPLPPGRDADAPTQIDALAAGAMAQQRLPGLAVVVLRGDQVVVARGYGRESLTRADPVTADTTFLHNSVGKQFTAAMIMALVEEGRLGLEDSVLQHLPDLTRLPPTLTVRHLLTQTSGVREAGGIPELWELFETADATWAQTRAALRLAPMDWKHGSRWSYSNTNYVMLQALAEQVAGQPLSALYAERFFRPQGLATLRVCPFLLEDVPGQAAGHVSNAGSLVRAGGVNNETSLGPGGLCGSARDLARWARLLATGRIVSPRAYALMTTPARLDDGRRADYGFGLGLPLQDGVRRAGHTGLGFGYSSVVAYYPDAELTIAVLANRFGFPDALERQIARRLLQLPEPDRRDVGISPEQRRKWSGVYDLGMFGWRPKVFERDGRLWFELFNAATSYALIQTADGRVLAEAHPDAIQLRFTDTPTGIVLNLLTGGTQPWSGPRLSE